MRTGLLMLLVAVGLLLANPPFIPNVPVSHDPGTGNQNETSLGTWGRNCAYGGWNDNRTGVYHVGFGRTTDGGLTWVDTLMMAPSYTEDGDPVIAVDDSGTVYYFWLNFNRSTYRGYIYLVKSRDSGRTWGPFINCTPDAPNSLNDKPWVTIDGNNIFLTVYDYGSSNGLLFRRSTNRGQTWSNGVQFGSGGNGTFPFRGLDSTVFVGWGFQNISLNKSTDMGRTWQGQRTVISCTWNPGSTPWRLNNVPSFATSRDRSRQYVAFADSRLMASQLDVFFSRSTDAGATWSTPVRINDNPVDTTKQFYPWISVDPYDRVHAVWYDTRQGGGRLAEYYSVSTDFGATWSPNLRASDTAVYSSTFIGDYQACVADSWQVSALWCDTRRAPGNPDAFFTRAPFPSGGGDVGCRVILAPVGLLDSGTVVTPACSVFNYGAAAASYNVRLKVGAGYSQVAGVANHAPGTAQYVTFPTWTARPRGALAVSCSTELFGDTVAGNDRATGTVTVAVHDVGVAMIVAPTGTIDSGAPVTPACSLVNLGTSPENYTVRMRIGAGYDQTAAVTGHVPGACIGVAFPGWVAGPIGVLPVQCSLFISDQVPANNQRRDSVRVIPFQVVAELPGQIPLYRLAAPEPNPFGTGVVIRYGLPGASPVSLRIYSAAGKLVRTLSHGMQPAGTYGVAWNGCDDAGRAVGRGVYYCRLVADGFTAERKLVKLE